MRERERRNHHVERDGDMESPQKERTKVDSLPLCFARRWRGFLNPLSVWWRLLPSSSLSFVVRVAFSSLHHTERKMDSAPPRKNKEEETTNKRGRNSHKKRERRGEPHQKKRRREEESTTTKMEVKELAPKSEWDNHKRESGEDFHFKKTVRGRRNHRKERSRVRNHNTKKKQEKRTTTKKGSLAFLWWCQTLSHEKDRRVGRTATQGEKRAEPPQTKGEAENYDKEKDERTEPPQKRGTVTRREREREEKTTKQTGRRYPP